MWEKMQLMLLMQQHFAQLLHLPEIQKLQYSPLRERLLLLLLLQLHAAHGLQLLRINSELNDLITTEK